MTEQTDSGLEIQNLLDPSAFPHSAYNVQLIETHISWVILAGEFAYKIKKPVDFGFVNYLSVVKRREYCEKEVELNRRFAPMIYLGVIPILSTQGKLRFGTRDQMEHADVVDYAVHMRQFPQDAILSERLDGPLLTGKRVEKFARNLADSHDRIEAIVPTHPVSDIENISRDAADNFEVVSRYFQDDPREPIILSMQQWSHDQAQQLRDTFTRRLHEANVRRCHGDLHLKNMILLAGEIIAFDGIEFNESFQCIDVFSELAFPAMDFAARGRIDLAWRMINGYLEASGQELDLAALRFYLVYRALVRAKVTCLNPKNKSPQVRQKYERGEALWDEKAGPWDKYLKVAEAICFDIRPSLSITHGFSGSGKSTVALSVIEERGGIRIRSDVERQRVAKKFQLTNRYSPEVNRYVYERLLLKARAGLESGFPVVVDATFLKRSDREPFEQLAKELGVDFRIVDCDAPFEVLCDRIRNRKNDPSEADIQVLKIQMENHDPLTTDELQFVATRHS